MMKAVDKFELRKGFKFSTYVSKWCDASGNYPCILQYSAKDKSVFRVRMVETINKVVRARRTLTRSWEERTFQ